MYSEEVALMPRIISIHEYSLRSDANEEQFEQTILKAKDDGLLSLPGLEISFFGKGIKGSRGFCYIALWIYENNEAWENLWGTVHEPVPFEEYPKSWQTWERQVLAPFLDRDPDEIEYGSYQEIIGI
jgi:hypothetical protein